MKNALVAILAGLLLAVAMALAGYWMGTIHGKRECQADHDAATVTSLREMLNAHAALVQQAQSASVAMREQLKRRAAADDRSHKALRQALAATADARAACVLDDDVMRQLQAARDAAAAAAAGGLLGKATGTAGAP